MAIIAAKKAENSDIISFLTYKMDFVILNRDESK